MADKPTGRRWRTPRPDGPYSNYGGKDLMSFPEIAKRLGMTESNVRNYAAKGMARLRMVMRIKELVDVPGLDEERLLSQLLEEGFKFSKNEIRRHIKGVLDEM